MVYIWITRKFDPLSNEVFLSGIYDRPYWIVECQIKNINNQHSKNTNKIFVSMIHSDANEIANPRYMTRSVVSEISRKLFLMSTDKFSTLTNK